MSTKEACERAMVALEEDRWLSPVSIDAIRDHVSAQDARIAELEVQLKGVGVEEYSAAKYRIEELEREKDNLRELIESSPKVAIQRTEMGLSSVVVDPDGLEELDSLPDKMGVFYAVPVESRELKGLSTLKAAP